MKKYAAPECGEPSPPASPLSPVTLEASPGAPTDTVRPFDDAATE